MSIFKDWREYNKGYRFRHQVKETLNPFMWGRLHKWRMQRADRGWSDYDSWSAGDHIAQMTAEMLQKLNDSKYTDWPEWFKLNVKEEGKGAYKDLQSVIDDIKNYLEFEKTSWADGLEVVSSNPEDLFDKREDGNYELKSLIWVDEKTLKPQSDAAITHRINKWHKEEMRLYKKAQKAMQFFGRHFTGFWD